jgi:predicted 3-demethylubiquinone-9 3-methyltransferase (glyoxalase superfamily)
MCVFWMKNEKFSVTSEKKVERYCKDLPSQRPGTLLHSSLSLGTQSLLVVKNHVENHKHTVWVKRIGY